VNPYSLYIYIYKRSKDSQVKTQLVLWGYKIVPTTGLQHYHFMYSCR